jgi:hypothetical protein
MASEPKAAAGQPAGKSVSSKIFEQGWVASIVVGILILSLTQPSAWGLVFSFLSMIVLLVTFCRFSDPPTAGAIGAPLYRTACRIGYVIGVFCLLCSLYWTFRSPLAQAVPGFVVDFVNGYLGSAEIDGRATVVEVSKIDGFNGESLFGQKKVDNFKIAAAHDLVGLIVSGALAQFDYTTKVAGIILAVMFIAVLLIHTLALYIWRAIETVRDGEHR